MKLDMDNRFKLLLSC